MTQSNDTRGSGTAGSALAWGTTSFEPGDHVGLVARRTIALIAGDNPSTRERLWSLVSTDTSVDDILEELSSTGIKSLPDFALAQVEGDGLRVVARGAAAVSVELANGVAETIDATDVRTWVEDALDEVVSVTMSIGAHGDAPDRGFAVLAGSVPAAMLARRFDEPDAHAVEGEQWTATPAAPVVEAPVAEPVDEPEAPVAEEPAVEEPVDDTDQAEPELAAAPDVELEPVDDNSGAGEMTAVEPATGALAAIDTDHLAEDLAADLADDAGDHVAEDAADAEPAEVPEVPSFVDDSPPPAAATPDIEAQSGAPVSTTAAMWGDGGDDASIDASGDADGADSSAAHPQPPPPAADAIPTADGPPPVVAPIDPAPEAAPAPFDAAADLESSLLASDSSAPPAGAPFDHDLVSDDDEVDSVGVLAFSNGERIEVDRPVLIGRNPKVTGSVDGPLPYIMKYEGPGQGLSRTHAEIRVEDGALVIEDLRSTNGTDVQPPGEPRRRLVGGEPEVIVPGTLIDFGDELRCMVEDPR